MGLEKANFARPAIVADSKGKAHMVGFVVGPDFHMSAAFVPISLNDGVCSPPPPPRLLGSFARLFLFLAGRGALGV